VALGALILLHGIAKVRGGIDGIVTAVTQAGLPAPFAYLVYVGEVVAPLLLIVGLWTRLAALVVAVNMVFAVYLAHPAQLFQLTRSGAWAIELQALFLIVAIVVALLGAGRYSLGGAAGRWN
jgi:putative oxidoreductase